VTELVPVLTPEMAALNPTNGLKVAVTLFAAVIVTVQSPVPLHPLPLHPAKTDVAFGAAVNTTVVCSTRFLMQSVVQLIAAVLVDTVPPPAPENTILKSKL